MSSNNPKRYQILQWINLTCGAHDMICTCSHPTKHLLVELTKNGETYNITKKEKKQIEKCLITTEEETTHGDDDDGGFAPGDLEILFGENADGEDTTG